MNKAYVWTCYMVNYYSAVIAFKLTYYKRNVKSTMLPLDIGGQPINSKL